MNYQEFPAETEGPYTRYHRNYLSVQGILDTPILTDANERIWAKAIMKGGMQWFGTPGSWDEVQSLVQLGWPEGLGNMQRVIQQLRADLPRPKAVRRRKRRGPTGDELDIHRVNSGHLDKAWSRTQRVQSLPSKAYDKRVTVLVDMSTAFNVKASAMLWRGAAALALHEHLTRAGYSVEMLGLTQVTSLPMTKGGHLTIYSDTFPIKARDQRMNLEQLATITGLGGFYRTYGFRCKLNRPFNCAPNLGQPIKAKPSTDFFKKRAKHTLLVQNIWSESAAVAFVNSQLVLLAQQNKAA